MADDNDRIKTGTGTTTGASPGTILGQALGGPIGVATGGALGGAADDAVRNTGEETEIVPQTSGYTRGYEDDIVATEAERVTLDFSGTQTNQDVLDSTGSDPLTGTPSDQRDTTQRIGD